MSGFDFDALRDPDAPYPGARERAGVDARALQLRSRRRRNRLAVSATSITAVAAILFGVIAAMRHTGPEIAVPGTTVPASTTTVTSPTTVGPSIDDRFIPPTSLQNGLVTLPVTLPDGESFTMRYPPALKIAQLGFAGGGGVVGFSGVSSRQVSIGYTNVQRVYGDTPPRSILHDSNGRQVALYEGNAQLGKLAFQFGPWLVLVDDDNYGMTNAQLETWARNLTGTVDANGYLVLHARTPLVVANWFEGGFGGSAKGNAVELANHLYCGQPESDTAVHRRFRNGDGKRGVSWCDGQLHVVASGATEFVDLADRQLKVTAATPPVGPTPTFPSITTTTTVAPISRSIPPARSATFVSAGQGWVLEKNGRVDATTDAGAHWRVAGATTLPRDVSTIRFADAMHGFAFGVVPNGGGPLWSTSDGGVHWASLKVPFSDVFDLTISRGVVYVVAMQPKDAIFRIWSSPADALTWTEDPLMIRPGAGPVVAMQLVLTASHGWLVENDRAVVAGAQLASDGRWAAWNPPSCNSGPLELAASSSSDLVALCDEGYQLNGGATITPTVNFSHDGAKSFSRRFAPIYGSVASPNPTTAVIAASGSLQRTTDEGASWHVVASVHDPKAYGATDLGFTTPTQGFVIFDSGEMLMTHDAGATWTRARLP